MYTTEESGTHLGIIQIRFSVRANQFATRAIESSSLICVDLESVRHFMFVSSGWFLIQWDGPENNTGLPHGGLGPTWRTFTTIRQIKQAIHVLGDVSGRDDINGTFG